MPGVPRRGDLVGDADTAWAGVRVHSECTDGGFRIKPHALLKRVIPYLHVDTVPDAIQLFTASDVLVVADALSGSDADLMSLSANYFSGTYHRSKRMVNARKYIA